ncbi:MAG: hypothetical protein PF445_02020 [Melioribacteraceae bacterium]|jgi:hypothetical protein|nr:hypothetical protein [Melioribacteraceae bacterium]
MKKALLTIVLLSFGIWGCSENTSITAPEKSDSQQSFLKVTASSSSELMKKSVSETIDGEDGGMIKIRIGRKEIHAKGWLDFPEDSFEGEEKISIRLAEDFAALDFEPSGIPLELPALLTLTFSGLELEGYDEIEDEIEFQYIDEDGNLKSVDYETLIVKRDRGRVTVVRAELKHFSRYGFTK